MRAHTIERIEIERIELLCGILSRLTTYIHTYFLGVKPLHLFKHKIDMDSGLHSENRKPSALFLEYLLICEAPN